jgi:predicted 3-demethylubiquinone-9 3-methyltransferase (glyoxalase superfamily)
MRTITPFLWFDGRAEEAMNFYVSIFKEAKIINARRRDGKLFTATFELLGQRFMALNAEPLFKFNESVSFFVNCDTQEEVDELWEKLSFGGQKSRCGWLKDQFGLSWQIIPKALGELLGDPDPRRSAAVMQAMLGMSKIVIADLRRAHESANAA